MFGPVRSQPEGVRLRSRTALARPRSSRTGQRSQETIRRPSSSRITRWCSARGRLVLPGYLAAASPRKTFCEQAGHRWWSGASCIHADGIRRCCLTMDAGPRSKRIGQRSQWMTARPRSSRITVVSLSEASDEAGRAEARRAESAEMLVLARLQPATRRAVRRGGTRGAKVEPRVAPVTTDDHASCDFARHETTLAHETCVSPVNGV